MTKDCPSCGEEKPHSEYHKRSMSRDGLASSCKPCVRSRQRKYYSENPGLKAEQRDRWRKDNPEKYAAQITRSVESRRKRLADPEEAASHSSRIRDLRLQREYGISQSDYDSMLDSQGGCCAICESDDPKGRHGVFHVDHCHETGAVRGLLCSPCNQAIGLFQEDEERMSRAILYLKKLGYVD